MKKTKLFLACVATLSMMAVTVPVCAEAQDACQGVTSEVTAVSTGNNAEVRKANIYWRYYELNGRVYKRLYDYDKDVWVGDWILVK